ncbi:MAG: hypothetical protein HRT36_09080 [Alphaproteobacteria bacterium]|nr:hypothetical protein [Alphaproteobacteria bacterium]
MYTEQFHRDVQAFFFGAHSSGFAFGFERLVISDSVAIAEELSSHHPEADL